MKYQWKFQRIVNGNPLDIHLKIQWNTNGNPLEVHLEFNSNFNGIPVGSIVNPVKISIIYQLKFQSNDNRN